MKLLILIGTIFGLTSAIAVNSSVNACQSIDCGEDYSCVEVDFQNYGFECRHRFNETVQTVEIHKRSLYFETSCPTIRCQNEGMCKIDMKNMNSSCVCKYPFVGEFCQTNGQWLMDLWSANDLKVKAGKNTKELSVSPSSYYNEYQHPIAGDICRSYQAANVELCKNGGYCLSVFTGKALCICPITTTGDRCENLVYIHCPTPLQLCHKTHGVCTAGNQCVCKAGYTGPRCDEMEICSGTYCFNGGTCEPIPNEPFRKCSCKAGFTGDRCERTLPPATTADPKRCNYVINLRNQGGFLARVRVIYSLDGIRQPVITSRTLSLLERSPDIEIPFKAEDIRVKLEYHTTFEWKLIFEDSKLGIAKECLKCYKTWGSLFKPSWDYLLC